MLLTDLEQLHAQLLSDGRLTPPGFHLRQTRLLIDLDVHGGVVSAIDAGRDGPHRLVPALARSGQNPPACVVVDNGQYVLGIAQRDEPKEVAKAARARSLYLERLDQAVRDLADAEGLGARLLALQAFLSDLDGARAALRDRGVAFEPGPDGVYPMASALVGFRIDELDPIEHPALQRWWAAAVDADLGSGTTGTCQVTGAPDEMARKLPAVQITGGTQPKLISSNFSSAERYGARQSSGSQIGVGAAVRTHQALNWLLQDAGHHRRMGGLTFAWWVVGETDWDPFSPVLDPAESVDQMMGAVWRGKWSTAGAEEFRLLALSVNEARVVIRVDHTSTLSGLRARVDRWLRLVEVPGKGGAPWRVPIGVLAEAASGTGSGSARQAQRDRIVADLAIALVTGHAPSDRVRNAAVLRCRAERRVSAPRAALLKICQQFQEVDMQARSSSTGELCGRLLAQLEQAQWAGLGDTNRTVTDRYYAKASVNPEQVFPQLLRGAQAHLSKAGRRSKGAQVAISRRLGELAALLQEAGGIPRVLSMQEQAAFALGYWTERQSRFSAPTSESTTHPSDEEGEQ